VPVYGLGRDPKGRPFYAMRFIDGESLKDAIARFHSEDPGRSSDSGVRTLALRQLLGRFLDVCDAMSYAHSRGILHRDLKPGNIMLCDYGETLVVDWGLARPIEPTGSEDGSDESRLRPASRAAVAESQAGDARGTRGYMSPEQAAGSIEALGPGSDVYSLGATLYCLLTGKAPPQAPAAGNGAARHDGFLRPRQLDRRVPPALEAICLKALAPQVDRRYASARSLRKDLADWLDGEPVEAYREPLATRLARWVRRHKPLVAGLAAVLVTTTVALAVHSVRIAQEKALVEAARKQAESDLRITRQALDQMLLRVAAGDLAYLFYSEPLRHDLADRALAFNQKLLAAHPHDPAVRFDTVRAYHLVADLRRWTGRDEPARSQYSTALELIAGLIGEFPNRTDYRRRQAELIEGLGELHRMRGRPRLAETNYRQAIALAGPLRQDPLALRAEATARMDLALALDELGRYSEAREAAEQAIALLRPMADRPQPVSPSPLLLVHALDNLGRACCDGGDSAAGQRAYAEAVRRARALVARYPVHEHEFALAEVIFGEGKLLAVVPRRRQDAIRHFNDADSLLKRLVQDHARVPGFRLQLAITYLARGEVLAATALDAAEQDCLRALKLLDALVKEDPASAEFRGHLGRCLAALSRVAARKGQPVEARSFLERAIEALEKAHQLNPDSAGDRALLDQLRAAWNRERVRPQPAATAAPP
jgi:serine/threonine-protein kinase